MRHVTMVDPLGSRVLVIEGGRPRGGTIIGGRERVGEPATIHVKLDPLEEGTAVEYRTLPASEVWIDTAALERWADAETRYRLAEELRRRAEDERELCTCGHPRRAHHAGGVDDGGCTACECTAYADQIERLTRERDEARRQVAVLTEGLRLVSGALARLDQIYRADTDLGDPPVETPTWLQEAQYRAAALLAPHHPDAGAVEQAEKGGHDA